MHCNYGIKKLAMTNNVLDLMTHPKASLLHLSRADNIFYDLLPARCMDGERNPDLCTTSVKKTEHLWRKFPSRAEKISNRKKPRNKHPPSILPGIVPVAHVVNKECHNEICQSHATHQDLLQLMSQGCINKLLVLRFRVAVCMLKSHCKLSLTHTIFDTIARLY